MFLLARGVNHYMHDQALEIYHLLRGLHYYSVICRPSDTLWGGPRTGSLLDVLMFNFY